MSKAAVPAAALSDLWQARVDRLRQFLPLPLLLLSTVAALALPTGEVPSWVTYRVGLPLAAAAALWWALVGPSHRFDASAGWRWAVFWVHTALAGVLVWVHPAYGVFAYTGFLFAYGLGRGWRLAGFAATALVVSASLSGGYPDSDATHAVIYLVIAGVMLGLVFNSASITNLAIDQSRERGRMIDELARTNERLEASVAENAALHARLVAQAREAGVVEERHRLAGEIHDTLAQALAGIVAQLQAAERVGHRPAEWSRHLDSARTLARTGLTEARRSVRALRPEQLEAATLPEAVADLVRTWSDRSGIAATVDTTGEPARAPGDAEAALFRVAQEALSNVAKHAGASNVTVTLTYLDDALLLDVHDDGSGFDPSASTDGYGLAGMAHRLAGVRGRLTVESAPGVGTTVNADVPLGGPPQGGEESP